MSETRWRSSASANMALTSRWQSSNAPATRRAWTLPPRLANCFSCSALTRPSGYSTTTDTPGVSCRPAATAPPVSPDVATSTTSSRSAPRLNWPSTAARKRAPMSLNASVGPWNSSRIDSPGSTATSGSGNESVCRTTASSSASGHLVRPDEQTRQRERDLLDRPLAEARRESVGQTSAPRWACRGRRPRAACRAGRPRGTLRGGTSRRSSGTASTGGGRPRNLSHAGCARLGCARLGRRPRRRAWTGRLSDGS